MHRNTLLLVLFLTPFFLAAQPKIQLVDFATGFDRPVDIAHCGDSRLFVVEQDGKIWIVDTLGNRLPEPFLDIDARVNSNGNEQGLLGLAFHPQYAQNGYFFVNYIKNDQNTRVARFSRDSLNANKADPNSEFVVLEQTQPYSNHNGGCLKFSPLDGMLYIGLGDGGSGGDPQNNGQKKTIFLGKILRLEVNNPVVAYTVPADNPFVGDPQYKPEIWSLGWRNPWRFSFDRLTGDLWVGDVGQNAREEIDYEPANTGGRNYGWRCYEGKQIYNSAGCQGASGYIPPVYDYVNPSIGCSVTGGFIYRGAQYSDLFGIYLHSDYCSGRWWATRRQDDGTFSTAEIANLGNYEYSSLGEDIKGELYVATLSSGKIQKITEICSSFQLVGLTGDSVCYNSFSGAIDLTPIGGSGTVTYAWSNGTTTEDNAGLDPGTYIVVAVNGNGCERRDTFTIESASPPAPAISLAAGDTLLCAGDTSLLQAETAPAGYEYQWYLDANPVTGATGQQLEVTGPGLYSVAYTSPGCESAPSSPVNIGLVQLQAPVIELIQGQTVLCPGDSAVLGAHNIPPGYEVQWFNEDLPIAGATGARLTVTEYGNYTVRFSGPCGTEQSSAFLIDQEVVIPPSVGQLGDTLFATPGWFNYAWYFNGQLIPDVTGNTYIPTQTGLYAVHFISTNGCIYNGDILVEFINTALPASVTLFSLSPNPTRHTVQLLLNLKTAEHVQLSLTDSAQRQVFLQTHQSQQITKTLEMQGLPAGTYLLHVKMDSGSFVRRIVKQ